MAHIHSVYDTDKHFTINPASRELENQTPEKVAVMQYDHDSERVTFDIPRHIADGHDVLTCNQVEVHYLNIDAQTKVTNKGMYEVTDLQLSPADDAVAICSWLISQNATQLIGPLYFRVTFKCVTEGNTDYRWSTAIYKGLSVSDGINNSDYVAEEYADILEQWHQTLLGAGLDSMVVVTITYDRIAGYSADKTYDEILAARTAGKAIIAFYGGWMYTCTGYDPVGLHFTGSAGTTDGAITKFKCTRDNVWTRSTLESDYANPEPLILYAADANSYLEDSSFGDEALEAIKTDRQILVRVPNADGGSYTAIYSPVLMHQVPNYQNRYLYLFFLRDEKQDLSALVGLPAGSVVMPTYGQLKMLLSQEYNNNPLEA